MTEPAAPRVAIIIAAHNAERTVARAVASALRQPEAAEIVVVDDASTDATRDAARRCDDATGRLSLVALARNQGPAAARNRGVEASAAPWIAVLEADDCFLPGRLAALLAHRHEADFIADDPLQVEEGETVDAASPLMGEHARRLIGFRDFVLSNIPRRGRLRKELGFLKPLMRRSFLAAHALAYREDLRLGEDYELYARALAHGARFLLAPERAYVSVLRPDSLSARHTEEDLARLRDCDLDLAKLSALSREDVRALMRHYRSTDAKVQWLRAIRAVKARDVGLFASAMTRSWPATAHVVVNLLEQAWLRGRARLRSVPWAAPASR